jgi:predicted dehydrogenase
MIKIGFLGGGINSIAGRVHLIASQIDNNFKVIGGIFSKDKQKSILSAKEYKVKNFNSIEEMANEVDIIVVLTPTPNHYNDLKEILKYDVGIIVDKPLLSYPKSDLNFKDKFIVVTHNYSGYPLVREMQQLIQNNHLGNIKKLSIKMYQESFFKPMKPGYPQKWRLQDKEIPTIALDLGVHTYHLASFLLKNKLIPFFCEKNSFSKYNVIDDCIILARSKDILIELSFSKIMLGNSNPLFIEVYGDKAGVKWKQNDFENLYITYSNGKKEILSRSFAYYEANKVRYQRMAPGHPSGFIEAFANLYQDIFVSFNEFQKNKKFDNNFVYDYKHSLDSLNFFKEIV